MQKRHLNKKQYFEEQGITTEKYVIPYIESVLPVKKETRVLEIGCGEGGNLMPFLKRGCEAVGVDLNAGQINRAGEFIPENIPDARVTLINRDIYKVDTAEVGKFDLIMMRDVIEHIHNQEKFMGYVKSFLKPGGCIFFGFPPWYMPFGGHQQVCRSKALSRLPFFHLLPKGIYKFILKTFGENPITITHLLEIKETGIGINRFERIIRKEHYEFKKKTLFFINPNYEVKFKLKPRTLSKLIAAVPHVRDLFTTCYYCVVKEKAGG